MITFHSKTPLPWGAASALLSRATGGSKEREETEELGAKKKKKKKRKNRKKSKEGQSACLLLAPAGSVGEGGAMGAEQDSSDEESDVDQAPLRAAERAAEDEGRSARNGRHRLIRPFGFAFSCTMSFCRLRLHGQQGIT